MECPARPARDVASRAHYARASTKCPLQTVARARMPWLLCFGRRARQTMFFQLYESQPTRLHAEEVFSKRCSELWSLKSGDDLMLFINHSPCGDCADRLAATIVINVGSSTYHCFYSILSIYYKDTE